MPPADFDFRELFDLASDAIIVREPNGTIVRWNAGAERLYGISSERAIGRTSHDVLATEFPQPLEAIDRELRRAGRWEGTLRQRTAGGTEVIVASRWVQRQPDGLVLEINRDETARHTLDAALRHYDTARKNAEDALAQSRARLDFVANSADVGVWSCDLPFSDLIWNSACKAHFGLTADTAVTIETFYERMHPDDVERTRRAIEESIQTGGSYDITYRTRQQDDSFRWIRAVGRTEYDDQGTPRRFEGITVDVSATKHSEERFREMADAMPQIVWSADAQGRVDYLNRRWYELTGKDSADQDTSGVMHPDDRDGALASFQYAVETGEPWQHEYRLMLPNSPEPRWFLGRARPIRNASGRVVRWYATSTDIHDQKRIEAELLDSRDRLRAALDASMTGTFRWDIASNTLDWDDNLDRLFGLAPGTTARSLSEFVRMVHPEDRQRVIDACARCSADSSDFVEEFRVVWPDGTVRWLFDQGRVVVAKDGHRYMTGACVDITDRRNKEDALRAADRQKDEFLGMLAHEIRNPLAPIIYSVSILDQRIHDPAVRPTIDVIGRQATRMIRIV
ncbi:MAG TPA: PAS domain-containing protein, partial [Vicinamibacterales bacterium]